MIVGRVFNISNEDTKDSKLKEAEIGVINTNDSGDVYRMKLNLQAVPNIRYLKERSL